MAQTPDSFTKAFNDATKKPVTLGDAEKELITALREIADEFNAGDLFTAEIEAGMQKDGSYIALKLEHRETRCAETFYIGFGRVDFYRSIVLTTGDARHPFGAIGERGEVNRAEKGYSIQYSTDRQRLLQDMGLHMGNKVNARRINSAAAAYINGYK